MKSVMAHQFSQVPRADIPRSSFNRSHGHKTTFDADYLVPILVDDVIPGDSFKVNANFFARLATPLHPIMDNMYLDTFFFFVPYRLLWDNWEKFCGAQDDPSDSIDYTIPAVSVATTTDLTASSDFNTLCDYMGLPYKSSVNLSEISALPFRAYNLIYNEWFRDQNLQNSLTVDTDDGPDAGANYDIKKRGKRHDYFTSALPSPQKGSSVSLPLQGSARVETLGGAGTILGVWSDAASSYQQIDTPTVADVSATTNPTGMYANLANSGTIATINDLRLAFQTQRLLERDARSGTRYRETIRAHFGVETGDFRLQRPEFLGGGSTPINITPLAQQSAQTTPVENDTLGQLAGIGTVSGSHGFTKSFVEHGVIIGLANVRADLTYSQGLERYWSKSTRYDFYYPVLSNLGEQSILNSEIFYQNTSADDDVFGYQERYAEYRYKPSRLSGLMRVDNGGSLDTWHLSEDFSILPTLTGAFIESNLSVPLDRAIAISSEPHFIADFYFDMKCARPMPLYGVPGNLDHL